MEVEKTEIKRIRGTRMRTAFRVLFAIVRVRRFPPLNVKHIIVMTSPIAICSFLIDGDILARAKVTSLRSLCSFGITLTERKLTMLQIQGVKGEAVGFYCEPLITQEMGYHRLSRRINKMEKKQRFYPTLCN